MPPLACGLFWLGEGFAVWLSLAILTVVIGLAVYGSNRNRPGDLPRAVAMLIAGICLLDGLLIAAHGHAGWSLIACCGFVATLTLHGAIKGT